MSYATKQPKGKQTNEIKKELTKIKNDIRDLQSYERVRKLLK